MSDLREIEKLSADQFREAVRDNYGQVAQRAASAGCCGSGASCCGPAEGVAATPEGISAALGYNPAEMSAVPEGSNLGLGCGNPQAIASLRHGEVVLDLGSGAGFDSFLAARAVGDEGKVIGVDMTAEMIAKARANAEKAGVSNVEFRLGEIERLPVNDNSVDVIISNCVINLSPEKERVFSEAFRVLKAGGRVAISDVVATAELPKSVRNNLDLYTGCIGGAAYVGELRMMIERVGFQNIEITAKDESKDFIRKWVPGGSIEDYVVSASITAVKTAQLITDQTN